MNVKVPVVFRQCILLLVVIIFVYPSISSKIKDGILDEYHVINPGEREDKGQKWDRLLERRDIYRWARSRGLKLLSDKAPVVDNVAGFISRYGLKITVDGLERSENYRMWIDFVTYESGASLPVSSMLKMYIGTDKHNQKLLRVFKAAELFSEEPAMVEIPYEYSIGGKIHLYFKEYTYGNNIWGIWDIIVSHKKSLPDLEHKPAEKKIEAKYSNKL